MSTYVSVVISPATTTSPVVTSVSQATRPLRVVGEDRVEDGVRDLVGDLVGVALGDRLGGEGEGARGHAQTLAGSRSSRSLVGRPAPHQRDRRARQRAALEHRADALGDRQLDPEPLRRGRAGPARSSAPRRPGRSRRPPRSGVRAARDQLAGAAVAAARMPAGDDQVAHPGEPEERLRLGARRPRRAGPSRRARA